MLMQIYNYKIGWHLQRSSILIIILGTELMPQMSSLLILQWLSIIKTHSWWKQQNTYFKDAFMIQEVKKPDTTQEIANVMRTLCKQVYSGTDVNIVLLKPSD